MDALTHLIQLAHPQASLELRCRFEGGFSIDHERRAAGDAPFHLVLAGNCVLKSKRGPTLTLQAGDFVLFPRGGEHRISAIGKRTQQSDIRLDHDGMLPLRLIGDSEHADVDLLCGRFDYQAGPASLLLNALPDPLHVSLANMHVPALQTLVGLMRDEAAQRQPGALAIVTALSHALLALALRIHGEQQGAAANVLTLLTDARLRVSVNAMLNEPARAWTIAELGDLAAMSRATYARHFQSKAGTTVGEFLTQLRMTLACKLLQETARSVADIGMEVGYQSEAAFGKAFAQQIGVTPGRYRSTRATFVMPS
jgi:AraC family transcriptional activator of mtrCDE